MRQLWVPIFAVLFLSHTNAQISVQGELSGFFLTSEGKLIWHTVTQRETNLQPLWGHYRLVLTVHSQNKPVKHIELVTGRGQKIWQQIFEPPKVKCRIPAYPPSALLIHASDGFKFHLSITLADGSKMERIWKAPIDRPIHPFKIDWLSVAAATEAMRLMRVHGKGLFPQSSKLPIAWCFRGENGQLFVNHPKPPKGSIKVDLALLPNVSVFWLPERKRSFSEPGTIYGTTSPVEGKLTCEIGYAPIWANRDPSVLRTEIFNATMWVYIALHEALHFASLSTFNSRYEQIATDVYIDTSIDKWIDWLVTQWMEREALKRSIEAAENAEEVEQTKKMREAVEKGIAKIDPPPVSWTKTKEEWLELSRQWAWAFLQFRERRRTFYGKNHRWLTRSEQVIEWTENIAHWGAVQLIKEAERENMSPLLTSDPTAVNYPDDEFERWADDFSEVNPDYLSLKSVASIGVGKLLSLWDENWLTKAAKGRMLEDLLAEITGYRNASPEERNETIEEVASEIVASAAKLRRELQQFFAPKGEKICLSVRGQLPEHLSLEWAKGDETNEQLKAILLEWDDGSKLKIVKGGKVKFKNRNEVIAYAPTTDPMMVKRDRDQILVQLGDFISLKWLPESETLSVKVLGERWGFKKGKITPSWLPKEGWSVVQVGGTRLWLKGALRGGLQLLYEGGKRWDEAPMTPSFPQPAVSSLRYALTTEAPSELLFIARTVDKKLGIRSLTVSLSSHKDDNEFIAKKVAPKSVHELQLALPLKLFWKVERQETEPDRLVWFARFGNEEIRWFLGIVIAEVKVELANGKTLEIPFLCGVSHPMLCAVEAKAYQEMPSDSLKPNFSPAIGARCRVYLYRDKFDPEKAQCIAEGVTDETGKALLLIPAFNPDKIGLTASVLVEHEGMGCRRLEGLWLWSSQDHALFGSIVSTKTYLAPHKVTFTLEIEAVRQLYRAEIQGNEWREFIEREEPVAKLKVVVERREGLARGDPSQIIFEGEVEGRLTLTIPTLGHKLTWDKEEPHYLIVRFFDPVTSKERREEFQIGAHRLYYYEYIPKGEMKVLQLVGENNPPIKVRPVFRHLLNVTMSTPDK